MSEDELRWQIATFHLNVTDKCSLMCLNLVYFTVVTRFVLFQNETVKHNGHARFSRMILTWIFNKHLKQI